MFDIFILTLLQLLSRPFIAITLLHYYNFLIPVSKKFIATIFRDYHKTNAETSAFMSPLNTKDEKLSNILHYKTSQLTHETSIAFA